MKKIPNTFGIDVTAARFLEYGSEDELRELIAAGQVVAPWLHIGGGSNLLFIKDYEGTVLHSRIGGLEVTSEDEEHVSVRALRFSLQVIIWKTCSMETSQKGISVGGVISRPCLSLIGAIGGMK